MNFWGCSTCSLDNGGFKWALLIASSPPFFFSSNTKSEPSVRALTSLAKLHLEHPDLDLYGATPDTDEGLLASSRAATGMTVPVLEGVSAATREAWGVEERPAIRAVDSAGKLVARSIMGVLARLEERPAK